MLEEHNCSISTSECVLKLRYKTHTLKIDPSPTFNKIAQDNIHKLCLSILEEHNIICLV